MHKLTEKEYNEKKKKFKESFIYSQNQKQIIFHIIVLAISMYILFSGLTAFIYLIFYVNNDILTVNEDILELLITITSLFLTIGITGTFFFSIKIISLCKETKLLFKEFIEKKINISI